MLSQQADHTLADFQLWDSIQAICSYIRGILTSQAMLTGVGVGQEVNLMQASSASLSTSTHATGQAWYLLRIFVYCAYFRR